MRSEASAHGRWGPLSGSHPGRKRRRPEDLEYRVKQWQAVPVFEAVRNARRQGVSSRVSVVRGNLLDVDLKEASKVFIFLTPLLMKKVQRKVGREMPVGALVVSVDHRFPDWKPVESIENVHLYVVAREG